MATTVIYSLWATQRLYFHIPNKNRKNVITLAKIKANSLTTCIWDTTSVINALEYSDYFLK